jgi:hypothetical protein
LIGVAGFGLDPVGRSARFFEDATVLGKMMLQKGEKKGHPMNDADSKSATPVRAGIASFDLGEEVLIAAHWSKAGAFGPCEVMVITALS